MNLHQLRKAFEAAGQGHVFKFADAMEEKDCIALEHSLKSIDLDQIEKLSCVLKGYLKSPLTDQSDVQMQPLHNIVHVETSDSNQREKWRDSGRTLIRQSKVAALVMAGGQGTRLGSSDPKGLYDIGLISGKSLFQLHCERILRLQQISGDSCTIPFYIMTSPATHSRTVSFFEEHEYFGLDPGNVLIFQQSVVPCLTSKGKLMMESMSSVACSPNGNGGIYKALEDSGSICDMKRRGVEYVFTFAVDNCMVQICEPEFIGYCKLKGCDFGNKVLEKRDPQEKVGVLVNKNGKPAVVEYSEMSLELTEQRDEHGRLVFNAANIAIHCFSIDFLVKCTQRSLPFHIAHKKIPTIDDRGIAMEPDSNNGYKMEMFIFDSLEFSANPCAFFVPRFGNFSPLKNAPDQGNADSPETARKDFSDFCIEMAEKAGATIIKSENEIFEISPLISLNGEGLETIVSGKTFSLPHYLY